MSHKNMRLHLIGHNIPHKIWVLRRVLIVRPTEVMWCIHSFVESMSHLTELIQII